MCLQSLVESENKRTNKLSLKENRIMRTRNKISQWTFRFTFSVLVLFALLAGLAFDTTSLADGTSHGTCPKCLMDLVAEKRGGK